MKDILEYSMTNRNYRRKRKVFFTAFACCATLCFLARAAMVNGDNAKPSTGLLSARAIAINPVTRKVYVVDPDHAAVIVVDLSAHSQRSVKVGDGPLAVAVNPITNRVYVANTRSGTVSVLEGKSDAVLATVDVGKSPYVLAANPGENKVYVSNTFSDLLTIIDGATNTTKTVKAGSADAILVDSSAGKVYLLGYEASHLTILNGADNSLSKLPAGAMHLWSMTLDGTGGIMYVTRIGQGDVAAIDTRSHTLKSITTGNLPCAIAENARSRTLYVANCGDNSVTVINELQESAVQTIAVGMSPQAIAVDPQRNRIFVANTHGNSVTVIDGSNDEVLATLPAGINPYAIAVDAMSGIPLTANLGEPSFTSINIDRLQHGPSH